MTRSADKKTLIAAVAALAGVLVAGCASGGETKPGAAKQPTASAQNSTGATPPPQHIRSRVVPPAPPVEEKLMYLTFDDGPSPEWTPEILRVLSENGATATFFALGEQVQRHPGLVKQIKDQGSTVANHTWDHKNLRGKDDPFFKAEIERTQDLLDPLGGVQCVRPPYGAIDDNGKAYAKKEGLRVVLWNADTKDFDHPGADHIAQTIVDAGKKPGQVVLMHDGGGDRRQTVEGLAKALPQLKAQGFRFAPVCS